MYFYWYIHWWNTLQVNWNENIAVIWIRRERKKNDISKVNDLIEFRWSSQYPMISIRSKVLNAKAHTNHHRCISSLQENYVFSLRVWMRDFCFVCLFIYLQCFSHFHHISTSFFLEHIHTYPNWTFYTSSILCPIK